MTKEQQGECLKAFRCRIGLENKTIVQSDGIHLTADQLATANNLQQGIATAADVAGDVLTQMAPTDDTPLVATWGEITLVALERLGSKVGASIPGILRSR